MNTDPCKLSFNKWSKPNTMLSLNPKSKLDAHHNKTNSRGRIISCEVVLKA